MENGVQGIEMQLICYNAITIPEKTTQLIGEQSFKVGWRLSDSKVTKLESNS